MVDVGEKASGKNRNSHQESVLQVIAWQGCASCFKSRSGRGAKEDSKGSR
jgi:hypothetical protein